MWLARGRMRAARRLLNAGHHTAWRWATPRMRRFLVNKLFAVCFLGLMSAGIAACAMSTDPTEAESNAVEPGLEPATIGP